MLHRAINYYIIERFGYVLVFHSINYHGINTEHVLKYLYGGTFEKCKLYIETHCIIQQSWNFYSVDGFWSNQTFN